MLNSFTATCFGSCIRRYQADSTLNLLYRTPYIILHSTCVCFRSQFTIS